MSHFLREKWDIGDTLRSARTHARETTPRYDASRPPHVHDRKG